ncbi:MAG: class I SAM-dependent RNA methyltransferase [Bacteroidales bacterium]|nr:class I SAM-dependent RNA methyltransferase [Bacteroidales bacterium]
MEIFDITATTFFGLEQVLANELEALGAKDIKILNRAVIFRGDTELLYKCNLWLRTALKILVPIAKFDAKNERDLYNRVYNINWEKYFTVNQTFAIDSVVSGPNFTHSKYVALKTKDAICDMFRDKKGRRPDVDVEYPDLRLNIHIYNSDCTISLDSTGVPMSKRGYKTRQTFAPLNEVMAAGILKLAGWDTKQSLIDPMCGSGTFPIEACMMAMNIAPGTYRNFAFEKWNNYNAEIWTNLKKEARKVAKRECTTKIIGYDCDPAALDVASSNAIKAGLEEFIDFDRIDFFENNNQSRNIFIIMNPPYGERLEDADKMVEFYKKIGDKLKACYTDCKAWILSGNLDAIKKLGLHPSVKIKLFNGPIECKLECFELYGGSKKAKFNNQE